MTQIRKHVANLKISHFIRENKLVLFFGANKNLTREPTLTNAERRLAIVRREGCTQTRLLADQIKEKVSHNPLKNLASFSRANPHNQHGTLEIFGGIAHKAGVSLRSELGFLASILSDSGVCKENSERLRMPDLSSFSTLLKRKELGFSSTEKRDERLHLASHIDEKARVLFLERGCGDNVDDNEFCFKLSNTKGVNALLVKNSIATATTLFGNQHATSVEKEFELCSSQDEEAPFRPYLSSNGLLSSGGFSNQVSYDSSSYTNKSQDWVKRKPVLPSVRTSKAAFFQGPVLLLGLSDINKLEQIVGFCDEQDSLLLIGCFYNNLPLNHIQIRKLAALSKKGRECLILDFLNCVRSPISQFLHIMQKNLLLPIYSKPQHRLIWLFHMRQTQLLAKAQA